ncbi:MAG: alpha/beta hydrolase [Bacteroidetes bacterium]|nr:alpha/beta hydrolase [Bacteroidota bacterium]MBS1975205.1 alpha/beta hydrolase [Bacteroidota bacterium]
MKVYFISGLGADCRVFKHIQLPENCEPVYLEWIRPMNKEPLPHYASRLAEKIDASRPFAVIGLSMGGMVACEIARKLKPAITILLSSVPDSGHLPFYFKIAGKLGLYKAVPIWLIKSTAVIKRSFAAESNTDKVLIRQIIKESDAHFIRWAIGAVLKWKSNSPPDFYIHIHGTRDEVLPIRFTKPTHVIPQAGHLMVMTHSRRINKILAEMLKGVEQVQ